MSAEQRAIFNSGIDYFDIDDGCSSSSGKVVSGVTLDRFLQVISYQESRGKPDARNGWATGKYQYMRDTWRARKDIYGPSASYSEAYLAPEEVQDAVAYIEYAQKLKSLNNDFFKMAVSHFLPAALTNPSRLDEHIGDNPLTPRQYANLTLENMKSDIGSEIPLKYKEAPEFDTWLQRAIGDTSGSDDGSYSNESSTCQSGVSSELGNRIAAIARAELVKHPIEYDSNVLKYTGGVRDAWCAYFVSWVLKEAGAPFEGSGVISWVPALRDYAKRKGIFHPKDEPGFTPQPGDIAIYVRDGRADNPNNSAWTHVNIVIEYNASTRKLTTIGGNESDALRESIRSMDGSVAAFVRVQQ